MNKININYSLRLFVSICLFGNFHWQLTTKTKFTVTISRPYTSLKIIHNQIEFNMPLIYVTQVIYFPKININRPSPEDERVSHPN